MRFTWPFFPGAELWTGLKKGPPRKLKFPEPHVVLEELKKYPYIVSTIPLPDDGRDALPRVRILGEGTEGTVMTAKEIAALRKKFAAEIAALVASPNGK